MQQVLTKHGVSKPQWYLITALAQIITYDNYDWKTILVLNPFTCF